MQGQDVIETWTLAQAFLTAKRVKWARATAETAYYHLRKFAQAWPTLPSQPGQVEAFLASIPGTTYRWNTWRTLRQFFRWAHQRMGIPNPIPHVEPPRKPKATPYFLNEEELQRLLLHPDHPPRTRALLFLLADTGLRLGEAASLRVENLRDTFLEVEGKTGKRFVPVSPAVMAMIREIAPPEGPVWVGRRGPLTRSGLGRDIRNAFRRAGFHGPRMSAHRLRHTVGTLWSGPDAEGMALLGHRDPTMWQLYHHIRLQRLQETHRQHSPLAQLKLV